MISSYGNKWKYLLTEGDLADRVRSGITITRTLVAPSGADVFIYIINLLRKKLIVN